MEKASTQALQSGRTVILADGDFPRRPEPLAFWAAAERVVCCDGAVRKAMARGSEPVAVVGDGDSIPPALRDRLGARWVRDPGEADNDLAKAFRYCLARGWRRLAILGATGRREDHTLGNLSLLADFQTAADVVLATDAGLFTAHAGDVELASCAGQQVSLFTFDPRVKIRSRGLKYPLKGRGLSRWWQAALNEASGESFALFFTAGVVLVFRGWPRVSRRKPAW